MHLLGEGAGAGEGVPSPAGEGFDSPARGGAGEFTPAPSSAGEGAPGASQTPQSPELHLQHELGDGGRHRAEHQHLEGV